MKRLQSPKQSDAAMKGRTKPFDGALEQPSRDAAAGSGRTRSEFSQEDGERSTAETVSVRVEVAKCPKGYDASEGPA